MSGWLKGLLMLGIVGGIVGLDLLLWKEADLDRYLRTSESKEESAGGLTSPLDHFFSSILGDDLVRYRLEERKKKAKTVEAYGEILAALAPLYQKMEKEKEYRLLLEEAVRLYPANRHAAILEAHQKLAELYLASQEKDKALPILSSLWKAGMEKPVLLPVVENVLQTAQRGGFDTFFVSASKEALASPHIESTAKFTILNRLEDHFKTAKNVAEIAALAPIKEALKSATDKRKLFGSQMKEVSRNPQTANLETPFALLGEIFQEAPPDVAKFLRPCAQLISTAIRQRKMDLLLPLWENLAKCKSLSSLPSSDLTVFQTQIFEPSLSATAAAEKRDASRRIFEIAQSLHSSFATYAPFLETEKWLAEGKRAPAPRPYYRIAYRPQAEIALDGVLNEPVYNEIAPMPGPWYISANSAPIAGPTEEARDLKPIVKMFYTDRDLWIGILAPEPQANRIALSIPPGCNPNCWEDDCFEIFLDLERSLAYEQFVAAAGGSYALFVTDPMGRDWGKRAQELQTPLHVASKIEENRYTLEIRIPRDHLFATTELKGRWIYGNVRRNRWIRPPELDRTKYSGEARISWCNIGGGERPSYLFGFLEFE